MAVVIGYIFGILFYLPKHKNPVIPNMKKSLAGGSLCFLLAFQPALSVKCLYVSRVLRNHGKHAAFCSLSGTSKNVCCHWLVVLQSSCGLITWVGLVDSFRVFYGFTKLLAQSDHSFQIKLSHRSQLPVRDCAALITEHCCVNL